GDVFVPYLDKRIGVELGLNGTGGLTAAAGLPVSTPAEQGVSAGGPGYLVHLEVGGFMDLDVNALRFSRPIERPAVLELTVSIYAHGFRGHGHLGLPALKLAVDADIVVGRLSTGETFFYFYLAIDLPAGIPLFNTGAAFYGFQGLVANNMAPGRKADEPWYHG